MSRNAFDMQCLMQCFFFRSYSYPYHLHQLEHVFAGFLFLFVVLLLIYMNILMAFAWLSSDQFLFCFVFLHESRVACHLEQINNERFYQMKNDYCVRKPGNGRKCEIDCWNRVTPSAGNSTRSWVYRKVSSIDRMSSKWTFRQVIHHTAVAVWPKLYYFW